MFVAVSKPFLSIHIFMVSYISTDLRQTTFRRWWASHVWGFHERHSNFTRIESNYGQGQGFEGSESWCLMYAFPSEEIELESGLPQTTSVEINIYPFLTISFGIVSTQLQLAFGHQAHALQRQSRFLPLASLLSGHRWPPKVYSRWVLSFARSSGGILACWVC